MTARERRHTLHFLHGIRKVSPVFLDTEVDLTQLIAHRQSHPYSFVTYVLHAAAKVMEKHPDANASLRGPNSSVTGKLALDKTINGQRVVLSAVFPDVQNASLDDIQSRVEHYRDGTPEKMPEFAGVRLMHRLPKLIGAVAYRLAKRDLGTFAVTSLGHRPVDGFYSVGGTTITIGLGQITDRPVVRDEEIRIAPVMRLSLTFDHRVIDGAAAADVLADLKIALEGW